MTRTARRIGSGRGEARARARPGAAPGAGTSRGSGGARRRPRRRWRRGRPRRTRGDTAPSPRRGRRGRPRRTARGREGCRRASHRPERGAGAPSGPTRAAPRRTPTRSPRTARRARGRDAAPSRARAAGLHRAPRKTALLVKVKSIFSGRPTSRSTEIFPEPAYAPGVTHAAARAARSPARRGVPRRGESFRRGSISPPAAPPLSRCRDARVPRSPSSSSASS